MARFRCAADAERAVQAIRDAGLPVDQISVLGRELPMGTRVQGFSAQPSDDDAQERVSRRKVWLGGAFGILVGVGFFLVPEVGPLFVLGPMAKALAQYLGEVGTGALIAALAALGLTRGQARKVESHLKAGGEVCIYHGNAADAERASKAMEAGPHVAVESAPSR